MARKSKLQNIFTGTVRTLNGKEQKVVSSVNDLLDDPTFNYWIPNNAAKSAVRSVLINASSQNRDIDQSDIDKIQQAAGPGFHQDQALQNLPHLLAIFNYQKDPNAFLQNEVDILRESPYSNLTDQELNDYLGRIQRINELYSANLPQITGGTYAISDLATGQQTQGFQTSEQSRAQGIQELNSTIGRLVNSSLGSGYNAEDITRRILSGEIGGKEALRAFIYSNLGKKYGDKLDSVDYWKSLPADFAKYRESSAQSPLGLESDIGIINDILATRKEVADNTALAEEFLRNAPEQLAQGRNAFFSGQMSRAKDYLTNVITPSAIEIMNARGMAKSGAVGDLIATQYGSLQSSIEQEQLTQEEADAQLLADMAYKTTLQKLIQERGNVSGYIGGERANLAQKQRQGFQQREQSIQDKFDLDLFTKEQERALKDYQTKVTTQQDASKKAQDASFWGDLGQTVAQIAAGYTINKMTGGSNAVGGGTKTPSAAPNFTGGITR